MRRSLFAFVAPLALVGLVACDAVTDPDEPGTPVNLSFAPCVGSQGAPTWFAYQDGTTSWTRVTATTSGAFNFTLSRGRGGIATYAPGEGLFIRYASTAELQAIVPNCSGTVRNVSGNVTGYAALDNISIVMNNSQSTVFGSQTAPAPFTLEAVESNVIDLVAVRYRTTASGAAFEAFPSNVFVRRGVSGSTTPVVDFSSATEAGAPLQRSLTVTNISAGEELELFSYLATSTTTANMAVYEAAAAVSSGSAIAPFYGLAANRLVSGESQMLSIAAVRNINANTRESRFGALVYTDVTDKQFTFGPSLGAVSISGSSRPSASYTPQAGYENVWDVAFEQGSAGSPREIEVLVTKAYVGTASIVSLAVPDLSGVSGFESSWLLIPGSTANWSFLATNGDISILNRKAAAYVGADRSSTFTP